MVIELLFNCVLGVLILFYLYSASQLPSTDNPIDIFGASGFPLIIGALALFVLALVSLRTIREKKPIHIPMFNLQLPEGRTLLLNVVLLALYIALLDVIGFALSTPLYLFIAAASIGYRHWFLLGVFAILSSVVLVVVFGLVFYVPLPRGMGMLRELSYFIY